ncbi:MAG: hypothetical protein AB7E05_15030 [Sphingobium sp.]
MQLLTQEKRELLDLLRCDHRFCHGKAAGEIDNLIGKLIPPEPEIDQPLPHRGVLGIHQALLDQLQQPSDARLGFLVILPHLAKPIPVSILSLDRCPKIFTQQLLQVLWLQYLL